MDLHENARSCPASRALLVRRVLEEGWTVRDAAEAVGLSGRSAYRWMARYRSEGPSGLEDRSSRPHRVPHATDPKLVEQYRSLRQQGMTASEIAWRTGSARSTVARWLRRMGLGRLAQLAPPEPIRRYEKQHPGELLHLDTKKLGRIRGVGHRITGQRQHSNRGIGWEFAHVAIDDASRLAYVEMLEDEKGETAAGFLERALRWFAKRGVEVQRVLTDNGSCYRSKALAGVCRDRRLKHSFTRPYRPRTNGKAERFIQTLLREWAYAFAFDSSEKRTQLLEVYLHFYNVHREHTALARKPPISRLALNNVPRINS
jgi:transposase InsO family protein